MKTYKQIKVYIDSDLTVICTDSKTIQWVIEETQKCFPKCKISKRLEFQNEIRAVDISNLGRGMGFSVGWWLLDQLGRQGWEPFSANTPAIIWGGLYHLRLVTESD